jgi:hypothetical protein
MTQPESVEPEASKPRKGRPPSERGRLRLVLSLKGNDAWKDWLVDYAKSKDLTPTELLDAALAQMAKRDRHAPPPRRVD